MKIQSSKGVKALGAGVLGVGFFWGFFVLLARVLRWMPDPIGPRADIFAEGAQVTLILTLTSGSAGILVGVIAGLMKLSANRVVRMPADAFVWLVRGTPLLVQILFIYYAVPSLFPSLRLNEFYAAMLGLALNVGAYNAEVIRAGVIAVPKGQREAAQSLGLSRFQVMRLVILPQAIRIVIPPLANNVVALLKDSSLASSIGLLELTLAGNRISSETFLPVPVLTTIALVYLAMTTMITLVTDRFERRFRLGFA
jgi:polar amino acid transport system permease protein